MPRSITTVDLTTVQPLDIDKKWGYIVYVPSATALPTDIYLWCVAQRIKEPEVGIAYWPEIWFASEKDAMAFVLKFGGTMQYSYDNNYMRMYFRALTQNNHDTK